MGWTQSLIVIVLIGLTALIVRILVWMGYLYPKVTATLALQDSETGKPLAFERIYLAYDTGNIFRKKPKSKHHETDGNGCVQVKIAQVEDTTVRIRENSFIYRFPTKDLRRGKILNPPGKEALGKQEKGEPIPYLKIGVGSAIPDWCQRGED